MDDYDKKSLAELQQIAATHHHREIPPGLEIGDVIEWLRMLDASEAVPQPVVPLPVIPGLNLPVITELPSIPGTSLQPVPPNLPTITIPTAGAIPSIQPMVSMPFIIQQPQTLLNDEATLARLYGQPTLPWATDFSAVEHAKHQTDPLAINPQAAFQRRILHPNYRPVAPLVNLTVVPTLLPWSPMMAMPIIPPPPTVQRPIIQLPTMQLPTVQLPTVQLPTVQLPTVQLPTVQLPTVQLPTVQLPTVQVPTPIPSPTIKLPTVQVPTPIASPTIKLPTVQLPTPMASPAIKLPTMVTPSTLAKIPTLPTAIVKTPTLPSPFPKITVPTSPGTPNVGLPSPNLIQSQLPTGFPRALQRLPLPQAPQVRLPASPIVVAQPSIPSPSVKLPALPGLVVPSPVVARPTIPSPQPVVARPIVPSPQPVVARPTVPQPFPAINTPVVARPTVPGPTVPSPMVPLPQPTITRPTVPGPTVPSPMVPLPQPTVTRPTVPVPTVPMPGTLVPLPQTLTLTPAPKPLGNVAPGFTIGPQVAGYTSITATTLKPQIPNILGAPVATTVDQRPTAVGGQIILPKFNTLIPPIPVTKIKRPSPLPQMPTGAVHAPTPGTPEYIISVLNEIDPELFVEKRVGKNKKGYSRNALIAFSDRLGLTPSGRNKPDLIEAIQQLREDMGVN